LTTSRVLEFSRSSRPVGGPGEADPDACEHRFVSDLPLPALPEGQRAVLRLNGVATWSRLLVNGHEVLESRSMFARHGVDVTGQLLDGANRIEIVCLPLRDLLAAMPRRPRARWRTQLVEDNALRWVRTSLLGRCPGFAPGPPVIGPYRPVVLEIRDGGPALDSLSLLPRLEGTDGVLAIRAVASGADELSVELTGPSGPHSTRLALTDGIVAGELRIPGVQRWNPWTHGAPALHDVRVLAGGVPLSLPSDGTLGAAPTTRRLGFRELRGAGEGEALDVEVTGIELHVNGVRVFCRGAVWTPGDLDALDRAVELGMNMVRVPGLAMYESDAFHQRCDELGLLVWQDLMFANLDVPADDPDFRAGVEQELSDQLGRIAGHASLAVVCGSSELEQQVAMLGLDPALPRGSLLGTLAPAALRASGADAIWVRSAPCGGDLPFRPGAGIANYFGVGAYRRPLPDARLAGVRFAAECLAIANVPDADGIAYTPQWKAGVPRDVGAAWDFDDVRDHYLAELYGAEAAALRMTDPDRWLALSREVSGELMAEVFGEWRRADSPCGGGLILWLRDLLPGAGWGVLDSAGRVKVAGRHLARALAPIAVWTTDEGLGGVDVHLANDTALPCAATLSVSLYADGQVPVGTASRELLLAPHDQRRFGAEELLGRFVDVSYSYRFGPPAHDVIVASLRDASGALLSQAFRYPAGKPAALKSPDEAGVAAVLAPAGPGRWQVGISSRTLLWGVRLRVADCAVSDDAFSVEPGGTRQVELRCDQAILDPPQVAITALNLRGQVLAGSPS
jgi:beta-mannosidase